MATIWIVSADSNRARIFEAQSASGSLQEREALVHPESRLPERSLSSDAGGRRQSRVTGGSHGVDEAGKLHEQQAQQFARELAMTLKKGWQKRHYGHLVLVAAPRFLGLLRDALDEGVKKHVRLELAKDLTKLNATELRDHLPKRLIPRRQS
ncbi:MAG: host attachment protein [Arenicella sp.]|nr:host attachment protein [Arenicella sp.]